MTFTPKQQKFLSEQDKTKIPSLLGEVLTELNIPWNSTNSLIHIKTRLPNFSFDFWASTEKYRLNFKNERISFRKERKELLNFLTLVAKEINHVR